MAEEHPTAAFLMRQICELADRVGALEKNVEQLRTETIRAVAAASQFPDEPTPVEVPVFICSGCQKPIKDRERMHQQGTRLLCDDCF